MKKLENEAKVFDKMKIIFKNSKHRPYTNPKARSCIATSMLYVTVLLYLLARALFTYIINFFLL